MPIGTQPLVQTSSAVERIQESLQQQMDHRQKAVQGPREKSDGRKRPTTEQAPTDDQITIHADDDSRRHSRRDADPDDEVETSPENAEREDENAGSPAGHVDVTI